MEMQSKTVKIVLFISFNLLLLTILYSIPTNMKLLNNLCLFKLLTGKACYNCGMTRAFLAILHLDFYSAYKLNPKVIVVFPLTVGLYIYSWLKFIYKERGEKA